MHIVKSVGVMSVAKIMGSIYACMGVLAAPFFLLIGMAGALVGQEKNPLGGMFGILLALIAPIIYGLMGFIAGAIGALLYNLFANWIGGFQLELEFRQTREVAPYPIVPPPTPSI